jgi:hypothetical protein
MGIKISKPTWRELLEALRERYRITSKPDKSKMLDEYIDITSCHRKHAIWLGRREADVRTPRSIAVAAGVVRGMAGGGSEEGAAEEPRG